MSKRKNDYIMDFIGVHRSTALQPDRDSEIKMTKAIIEKIKRDLELEENRRNIKKQLQVSSSQ